MLSFSQMLVICKEIESFLLPSLFLGMKEIEENKWVIIFEKGKILISLRVPFSRFHLTERKFSKKESSFSDSITKLLDGYKLEGVKLVNQDRVLELQFKKDHRSLSLIVDFVPKRNNFYLVDEKRKILVSLKDVDFLEYPKFETGFATFEEVVCTSKELEAEYDKKEKEALFEKEKEALKKKIRGELQKANKRLELFKKNEEEGKLWEEESHLAKLLQSNLYRVKKGMSEIEVEDWRDGKNIRIKLDPSIDPSLELKKRFKKSQKLMKKQEASIQLAKKAMEESKALELELAKVELVKNRDELAVFKRKEEKKEKIEKQKKEHPFREFTTEKGYKIYIGKNDEDNEKLTFSYAHGSDIWMHAADVPGSHVVLRVKKEEKPDPESLQDAAQLAIYFSKAKKEMRGNVTITECKFVQRVKGKIGKVTISRHKTVYTVCDPVRLQRLFAKLLPG